ncbi:MAG TPA: metalloregulator ArsR/SmtB family transcription factor [Solirubrobacterales bacterium]|nr:metalloregulator ArsR/SmtB family transcription factor [Solirubrobacterales bacterium]
MAAQAVPLEIPHPVPDALVNLIAARFRVLAEPARIRLLDRLRDGEANVSELQHATGLSQQNVSKHLSILHGAGIVARRREGNFTIYAIADRSVFELCELACGELRRQASELSAIVGAEGASKVRGG